MPYIYTDTEEEGVEYADVVSRADYDAVIEERDAYLGQRDEAIDRAEEAEAEAIRMKEKYANRFLTNAAQAKKDLGDDVKRDTGARSFKELFAERENR